MQNSKGLAVINRRQVLSAGTATFAGLAMPSVLRAQPVTKMRIGVVPLLSSGPLFIAVAKGYFQKVGIEVELRTFADGALAIPALVAGELDATVATLNAGLFNAVSKGANYKLVLDRGSEKPGFGSTTILVSNKMYDAGVTGIDKFALLKGARFSMQAPGGIDHYLLANGLLKAGLDPRTSATYASGLTYPDIIKSMGTGVTDAAQCPVPLAFLAESNNVGKIIGTGADIVPNAQLGCWTMPTKFLEGNRKAAVAFAMAHIYAARLFVEAAKTKDPEIVKIIADATKVPGALIEKAAPRWTGYDHEGMPNTQSVLDQASFWVDTMKLISGPVPKDALFDLGIAEEAAAALKSKNPFV
ncbi:ABC transporter substrate-binding protein [Bosea caraganae]|uniref:ABC transporter substrate-binding protein n=1 Tax=Bosea caraganae TaxID=2763117 RepID=A0A370L804_9HYPH|nr:ABC transporter substrate-binding protein [Bosea caraganae]RDJ26294.1 ABC transporter substrate-binding protein [Bosea caraganae]